MLLSSILLPPLPFPDMEAIAPTPAAEPGKLQVLDLFSGIGGFSLGLERAGMQTAAFVEINPFARRVLAKHWPGVKQYRDIGSITAARLARDGLPKINVICGGFPCQDISAAGKGEGIGGERSGLWHEMLRVIAEVRPRWVIAENVAVLRSRGLDTVLRGLASIGYDAEWHCIPAGAIGACHRRDRVWIVAYPTRKRRGEAGSRPDDAADADSIARHEWRPSDCPQEQGRRDADRSSVSSDTVADTSSPRLPQPIRKGRDAGILAGTHIRAAAERCGWWAAEPDVGRVANGIPKRVDRLKALGNAVVPQIPELIGRAILASVR